MVKVKNYKPRKLSEEELKEYKVRLRNQTDDAFSTFSEMLINKIEEGKKSDWKQPWFAEGSFSWPKDIYGKQYNGINALMLSLHCEKNGYRIPVFATYDGLKALNRKRNADGSISPVTDKEGNPRPWVSVNKGEHNFPVFFSSFVAILRDEYKDSGMKERLSFREFSNLEDEERKKYKKCRSRKVYFVFNVDQSNLKESRPEIYARLEKANVPQAVEMPEGEVYSFVPLDLLIEHQQWICPIEVSELHAGESPCYSPSRHTVRLGTKEQYLKGGRPESWVNDAFHEMAHSTGHADYTGRFVKKEDLKDEDFYEEDVDIPDGIDDDSGQEKELSRRGEYAREELVAEVSAALCCLRYGIPKTIKEDSVPYVQNWLSDLHEKPAYIRTVLNDVKKATTLIDMRIDMIRREYLHEKDPEKLDIREDDAVDIDIDSDGCVEVSDRDVYGADRKQGENEGRDASGERREYDERRHYGGMRH